MIQMELNVKVCDVCRSVGRETEQYTISKDGQEVQVDLCSPHGRPLEALLTGSQTEVAPETTPTPVKRSTGRTAPRRVKSLTEVAELRR